MSYYTEIEYDNIIYAIEYDYERAEPAIYYPNDFAHPGSPSAVDLLDVSPSPDPEILEALENLVLTEHEEKYCDPPEPEYNPDDRDDPLEDW